MQNQTETYDASLARIRVERSGELVAELYRKAVIQRNAALTHGDTQAWESWFDMSCELAGLLGVLGRQDALGAHQAQILEDA